jgi:hypothetical protein
MSLSISHDWLAKQFDSRTESACPLKIPPFRTRQQRQFNFFSRDLPTTSLPPSLPLSLKIPHHPPHSPTPLRYFHQHLRDFSFLFELHFISLFLLFLLPNNILFIAHKKKKMTDPNSVLGNIEFEEGVALIQTKAIAPLIVYPPFFFFLFFFLFFFFFFLIIVTSGNVRRRNQEKFI